MFIILNCWFGSNSISSNNLCCNCLTYSNRTMIFQVSGEILMLREDGSLTAIHNQNHDFFFLTKSHNLIKQFWSFLLLEQWLAYTMSIWPVLTQNKEGRRELHFTNKKYRFVKRWPLPSCLHPPSVPEQEFLKALSTTLFDPWNNRDEGEVKRIIHTLALTSSGNGPTLGSPHFQIYSMKRN